MFRSPDPELVIRSAPSYKRRYKTRSVVGVGGSVGRDGGVIWGPTLLPPLPQPRAMIAAANAPATKQTSVNRGISAVCNAEGQKTI